MEDLSLNLAKPLAYNLRKLTGLVWASDFWGMKCKNGESLNSTNSILKSQGLTEPGINGDAT